MIGTDVSLRQARCKETARRADARSADTQRALTYQRNNRKYGAGKLTE
jgi:hypothetical protein